MPLAIWAVVYLALVQFIDRTYSAGKGELSVLVLEFMLLEVGVWLAHRLAVQVSHAESIMDALALSALPNRAHQIESENQRIKIELTRSRRYHRPLSVLVVQLASLEDPNAREILKGVQHDLLSRFSSDRVAQIIDDRLRQIDLVLRDHRERSVILCPETDFRNASLLARRISQAIKERTNQQVLWGVASFPEEALTFEDLIHKARERRLAYNLGSAANASISNLDAAFAEEIPQDILAQHSLVVIGRSSAVPLLAEINDQLSAPFDFATGTASERNMQIVYRVPAGMSVGYLQLLSSPYNQEKAILVLAGNTEEGVTLAGNALLHPELSSQLTGVFAVTSGTQVATGSGSSPVSIVGTMVPPSGAEVVINTPVPVSSTAPPVGQPPGRLLPVLIASGVAIVLIILLAIVSAVSRRRAELAALTTSRTNGNRNGHSR